MRCKICNSFLKLLDRLKITEIVHKEENEATKKARRWMAKVNAQEEELDNAERAFWKAFKGGDEKEISRSLSVFKTTVSENLAWIEEDNIRIAEEKAIFD